MPVSRIATKNVSPAFTPPGSVTSSNWGALACNASIVGNAPPAACQPTTHRITSKGTMTIICTWSVKIDERNPPYVVYSRVVPITMAAVAHSGTGASMVTSLAIAVTSADKAMKR
ncbi:hypothetical protein G6F22_017051 [Rhizopus arrhizus]|nr:hypothetical protein G6F22_017051 [Rhizopus arrhizus]